MPVKRVRMNGVIDAAGRVAAAVEQVEAEGGQVTAVAQFFDEVLIVWTRAAQIEKRAGS